jgi:hypothetical protein
MAMTTSNSINVKPRRVAREEKIFAEKINIFGLLKTIVRKNYSTTATEQAAFSSAENTFSAVAH